MKWMALFYHRHAHHPSSFIHRTILAAILHSCATDQENRSHCVPARQLPRQVLRTLSRPLQLTPSPFGQLPVDAAEPHPPAASCLSATCRWPAALANDMPPLRYSITPGSNQRVAARRPRGSAFPRSARPATWRWWRQGLVRYSSRVPRGHMPAKYTTAHLRHKGDTISNRRR